MDFATSALSKINDVFYLKLFQILHLSIFL